ncbi:ATP-binding protein [Iodobacter fluviatilis]|uniref:Phosphonate ABC transporter permease n=1 Tax=Iodobacter fluviatilis TaxID=537 RepID=A0A7G3GEK7_9NEIS|nr:ATP-binding protein [Iodobacter fluviatilis]QBC45569.1 phosphonate ABC transporter permease [Iodobacter fluviatilis]
MSDTKLHFQVDSRLATLLSQEYSSTEKALKELIDNGWDADAEQVTIILPNPMSDEPIVISDNGSGMTEEELRRNYLSIASDRRLRRGERTAGKNRQIKGRKGIGKFAGLMAASEMTLETRARGRLCRFTLKIQDLALVEDIEQLELDYRAEICDVALHGTTITLSGLHHGLAYPDANKLRQILLQDYGRQDDFQINVDGKRLDVDDISGSFTENEEILPLVGRVKLRFSISDGKVGLRQPGITLRVDGKSIGKPSFFGLENRDDFPLKLLKKLYGEIDADGLRDHVTAGWDSLVENSELLKMVEEFVLPLLQVAFKTQYGREIQLAQARLQKTIRERLSSLPEHKRQFADQAIKKILDKYYGEPESKVELIVSVLLEALERSDYRILLEHISEAPRKDVGTLADALNNFGLIDLAYLAENAAARSTFLDQLEVLSQNPSTLESMMHKAIESNLWIFGPEYSLFSSNTTLKRQIEDYLGGKYIGVLADKRPDLLLNENLNGEYLLIEFKRPNHSLNYTDYQQATAYRHEFKKYADSPIRILLIGGKRSADFPSDNREPNTHIMLFDQVISSARKQVEWQLRPIK